VVGEAAINHWNEKKWSALADDFRTFLENGASFELAFLTA